MGDGSDTNDPLGGSEMKEQLLTVTEAAERLALRPATVRKMLYERRLPRVRVGRRAVRIRESDIEALIRLGFEPAYREDRR